MFRAIAKGANVAAEDLAEMNAHLAVYRNLELTETAPGQFSLAFSSAAAPVERMLGEIVRSAVDLLLSKELEHLKQCHVGECGWLFLDTSRNRSRRWCSMNDCGNRAKAKRHYRRKSAGGDGDGRG